MVLHSVVESVPRWLLKAPAGTAVLSGLRMTDGRKVTPITRTDTAPRKFNTGPKKTIPRSSSKLQNGEIFFHATAETKALSLGQENRNKNKNKKPWWEKKESKSQRIFRINMVKM